MTQERQNQDIIGESLTTELWRMWSTEIKAHFVAEAEFLQKYGEQAGYDRGYIARVLADHRLLEELVWGKDDESVARFAKVLAAHIQYKQAFFEERVRTIVEAGTASADIPATEKHS